MFWRALRGIANGCVVAALFACGPTGGARETSAPAVSDVSVAELPREARETLAVIRKGGPFAYRKDGSTFGNREGHLPPRPRGYYTEYTVRTASELDRGARRIVAGKGSTGDPATSGEYYYTDDHYNSFRRMRE